MKTYNCGICAGTVIVVPLFLFPSWPAHLCWARHVFPLPLFAFVSSLCRRSPSQTAGEGDTDCRLPASGGTLVLHTCQTSAYTLFFHFQPGVDPLSKPRGGGGSIRPEEGIKVGMNVTTWSSWPSVLSWVNPEGSHWLVIFCPHLLLTTDVAHQHLITRLMLAVRGYSEVSPSTSLVGLKVNASPRRSIFNFSCFLKEPCAFHACGTCNSGELIS